MVWLAAEVFGILMRWAHIASAAVLIGGLIYARLVAAPAVGELSEDQRLVMIERLGTRFRILVYAAIGGLVVSGLYNYMLHRGHTAYYHMWFGIKILLALHLFAAAALAVRASSVTTENEARRLRRLTGAILSGLLILLVAAYLRRIY